MKETGGKRLGLTGWTCPHYEKDFSGYCEGCNQRGDCMLQAILHKVESLEAKVEGLSPGRVDYQHTGFEGAP